MSASAVDDLMAMMEEDGLGVVGRDIHDYLMAMQRSPTHGILVRQRSSSPEPDPIMRTDTALMTVTVMGAGTGDVARRRAMELADRVYRTYALACDREVDGTLYYKIHADAPPYEQPAGDAVDYVVGIRMERFYGTQE